MTEPEFRTDLDEARGVLVVHGELDEPATIELRETITQVTSDLSSQITLDLGDVSFMPSPAIGVLATSQAKARRNGADLVLLAPEGTIAQRLLNICGLDHVTSLEG